MGELLAIFLLWVSSNVPETRFLSNTIRDANLSLSAKKVNPSPNFCPNFKHSTWHMPSTFLIYTPTVSTTLNAQFVPIFTNSEMKSRACYLNPCEDESGVHEVMMTIKDIPGQRASDVPHVMWHNAAIQLVLLHIWVYSQANLGMVYSFQIKKGNLRRALRKSKTQLSQNPKRQIDLKLEGGGQTLFSYV